MDLILHFYLGVFSDFSDYTPGLVHHYEWDYLKALWNYFTFRRFYLFITTSNESYSLTYWYDQVTHYTSWGASILLFHLKKMVLVQRSFTFCSTSYWFLAYFIGRCYQAKLGAKYRL